MFASNQPHKYKIGNNRNNRQQIFRERFGIMGDHSLNASQEMQF